MDSSNLECEADSCWYSALLNDARAVTVQILVLTASHPVHRSSSEYAEWASETLVRERCVKSREIPLTGLVETKVQRSIAKL